MKVYYTLLYAKNVSDITNAQINIELAFVIFKAKNYSKLQKSLYALKNVHSTVQKKNQDKFFYEFPAPKNTLSYMGYVL